MKYIIAIGIFQALLASFLLLRGKKRKSADDLLISLVVCIALHLSVKFFIYSFVKDKEVLNMMNTFIGFCYLPILYLYTVKVITPQFIPASRWYVFIPVILGAIGYFSTALVLVEGSPNAHRVLFWYNAITLWSMMPVNITFSVFIIWLAGKKLQAVPQQRTFIIQVSGLFLAMGLLNLLFIVTQSFVLTLHYFTRSISYTFLIVICIRIISFKYFNAAAHTAPAIETGSVLALPDTAVIPAPQSPVVVYEEPVAPPTIIQATTPQTKILTAEKRREILNQGQMFKILLKLENAMKFDKHYTDSDLTLDKLSEYTQQNKYHISETLNHFVNKPFYTFVNEYRIEFVKERLNMLIKANADINILNLAYEAGFKSKSSFNRYFKEITGQTPSEYQKSQQVLQ